MNFVVKGWGWERWIVNKEQYCGKKMFVAKDMRCSLHFHKNKDESFYVQSGKILLYYSDDLSQVTNFLKSPIPGQDIFDVLSVKFLDPGDSFHIPPGRLHQFIGVLDSEMYEFSTEHKEEDSYRLIKGD